MAPWLLAQPEIDLKLHEKIKENGEEVNVKTFVAEYIRNTHYTFLQIYTDGSKRIRR